jgi:hypothetical protein
MSTGGQDKPGILERSPAETVQPVNSFEMLEAAFELAGEAGKSGEAKDVQQVGG